MKKPFVEFKYRHELKNTLQGSFVMYDFRLEQFKREIIRLFNSSDVRMFFFITAFCIFLILGVASLIIEFI